MTDHAATNVIQEAPRVGWSTIHFGDVSFQIPPGWTAHTRESYYRVNDLACILSDLDRNEHGRHEGDVDSGDPTGVSQGNPLFQTGARIGNDLGGRAIIVPPLGRRSDPKAWIAS